MDIPDWLSFFLSLIEWARLFPVEWSSEVSKLGKTLLNIVLDSFRKCRQMAVASSVIFFDGEFPCWNSLSQPYIQPGKPCPVNKKFPHHLCFTDLTIFCATPWNRNPLHALVHLTFFYQSAASDTHLLSLMHSLICASARSMCMISNCLVGELYTDMCQFLHSDEMSWILLCKKWSWLRRTNMLRFIQPSCRIHWATWCHVFWEIVCENIWWRPTSLPPNVFVWNCPLTELCWLHIKSILLAPMCPVEHTAFKLRWTL